MQIANLMALLTFGSLWAGLLVVGGAVLASLAQESAYAPMLTGGASAIVAGGFVFQVVVADRLFPHVNRRLTDVTQTSLGIVLVLGIVLTTLLLTSGGSA